jgi:uracil-DNA glycosylase
LLERAWVESGIAACGPVGLVEGERLPPAHWRARSAPPRIVVVLGAEAAGRLLGRPVSLALERGRLRPLADGGRILVTEHPRAILRLSDPLARGREYRRLVNDLMMAVPQRRLAA